MDWASTSDGEFSYKLIKLKCLDGDLSLKLTVRYGDEHLWMIMINMIREDPYNNNVGSIQILPNNVSAHPPTPSQSNAPGHVV